MAPAEILETLKHSPKLPLLLDELNKYWQEEKKRGIQFYNGLNEDTKAEFIDGEIVMHSPTLDRHNEAVYLLTKLVGTFADINSLGIVRSQKALIQLTRNDYEPDICFFSNKKAKKIHANTLLYPAPDFVVEVLSLSTVKFDKEIKFNDYELHGIEEYWIIDPSKKEVEQYLLIRGKYQLEQKIKSGNIISRVIKGFEIPVKAIFSSKTNLEILKQLIQ